MLTLTIGLQIIFDRRITMRVCPLYAFAIILDVFHAIYIFRYLQTLANSRRIFPNKRMYAEKSLLNYKLYNGDYTEKERERGRNNNNN